MSRVFVDTSAVLALLVETDAAHVEARRAFARLEAERAALLTSSYVLVEIYALLGRRFGLELVQRFRDGFAPLLEVVWVDRELHERGLDLLLEEGARDLSLVDAASFVIARERGVARAFAFDRHYPAHGLERVR